MRRFDEIHQAAMEFCGGEQALAARLPDCSSPGQLAARPDREYLSLMSLRIFRAGLKHSMVDAKWPAFEEVFHAFEPEPLSYLSDDDIDGLLQDARIIRHLGKIRSVRSNAQAMLALSADYGSFGRWLADWPADKCVELWLELGKRFTQLGGQSGPYFLRMAGRDTFLFTDHVVRALNRWGVAEGPLTSKKDRLAAQQQFVAWQQESGMPFCRISMILANSID